MPSQVSPEPEEEESMSQEKNGNNELRHFGEYDRIRIPVEMVTRNSTERISFVPTDSSDTGIGICGWILTILSMIIAVATFPLSIFFCIKVVQEYERAVIFRLGRLLHGGSKGPGIFFILPCIENYTKVDLRTLTFDVPPQEVLTKDSVTVSVDAVVYYRVHNATVSVANVENAHHSTRLLAQTTLRNMLGTHNLHEILADRETISNTMQVIFK
ncbi:stomatin-2 [Trichonephila clavata]|uniref:Stomatin-2 n=1 Tax=Trichonephila clavata TaxID=2740835 RepID=A0A8X6K6B4_TRICU|nr:stomatin-2 [Trichonephila clavata]